MNVSGTKGIQATLDLHVAPTGAVGVETAKK